MDDGGILFDETSWKTHILTASAALVYETIIDTSDGQAISKDEAYSIMQDQLQLKSNAAEAAQLLAMLKMLGVIR